MIATSADHTLVLPDLTTSTSPTLAWDVLVTIAYATKSGGAELVAEELGHAVGGDCEVIDISELSPSDLDRSRPFVLIAPTYGDREIPSGAAAFYDSLQHGAIDLNELRFAVFGMVDKSYTKTYSRGSELLTEALTACGANRIGEYGRHDAGGPVAATDAALDWVVSIVEETSASLVR